MTISEMCPRYLGADDAAALIGVLAVLEGQSLVGEIDPHLALRLQRRLTDDRNLEEVDQQQFRQSLDDLAHRVRYALGEYAEPPQPSPVP